jgi:hypothetical protein
VIWDRAPIHCAQAVKDLLAHGGAARVHLTQLPAYAPELKPDEAICNYQKQVEPRNLCCSDLVALRPAASGSATSTAHCAAASPRASASTWERLRILRFRLPNPMAAVPAVAMPLDSLYDPTL